MGVRQGAHASYYVTVARVRTLIESPEYVSAAERARQGLFGESPCTQRLRLAYRVAARLLRPVGSVETGVLPGST